MEMVIKISRRELNQELIEKVNSLVGETDEIEITIRQTARARAYYDALEESVQQVADGNVKTFTWEEFEAMSDKLIASRANNQL